MKLYKLIYALTFIILFFLGTFFISRCPSGKTSGATNYAPDGYIKSIKAAINGKVIKKEQKGLLWITFNNDTLEYPFSYAFENLPKRPEIPYPENFIAVGDSIFKPSNTDTFYLIRDFRKW